MPSYIILYPELIIFIYYGEKQHINKKTVQVTTASKTRVFSVLRRSKKRLRDVGMGSVSI